MRTVQLPDRHDLMSALTYAGLGAKHFFYFLLIFPSVTLLVGAPVAYPTQTIENDCPVLYSKKVRGEWRRVPYTLPAGTKVNVDLLSTTPGAPHRSVHTWNYASGEKRALNPRAKLPADRFLAQESDLTGVCGLTLPLFGLL